MNKRIISMMLVLTMLVGIAQVFAVHTDAAATLTITQPYDGEWISYSDAPRLEWNKVDGAAGYRISIRNLGTDELVVDRAWTTKTYYTLKGKLDAAAAEYRIWVGAMYSKNDDNLSSFTSSTITVHTTPEAPEIENETWEDKTYNSVVLSMDITKNNGNAITDSGFYIVESSLSTSDRIKYSFKNYGSYSATTKGYKEMTITGLKPDTKYYFWAYAINGVGETITSRHAVTTDEYNCPHTSGVYTNTYPESVSYINIDDSKQHKEIWYYHHYCQYCNKIVKEKAVKEINYANHQFADGVCELCKYEKPGSAKFDSAPTLSLSIDGNKISGDIYGTYIPGDVIYLNITANYSDHMFVEASSSLLTFTNPEGTVYSSGTFVENTSPSAYTPKSYTNGSAFQIAINVPEGIPAGDYTISVTATDGVYDGDSGSIAGTSYYDSVKKIVTVRIGTVMGEGDSSDIPNDSNFPYPQLLNFSELESSYINNAIINMILPEFQDYVLNAIKYHIASPKDDYRVAKNLLGTFATSVDGNVIFVFDGVSRNLNNVLEWTGNGYVCSNGKTSQLSAVCIVVRLNSDGIPTIAFASANVSTFADQVRGNNKNDGLDHAAIFDGIYNMKAVNHTGASSGTQAALQVIGTTASRTLRFGTNSSYSTSNVTGIDFHYSFGGITTSTSANSTGCFTLGANITEYCDFINAMVGLTKAYDSVQENRTLFLSKNTTSPLLNYNGDFSYKNGDIVGIMILDRSNYIQGIEAMFGPDNNRTASEISTILTAESKSWHDAITSTPDFYTITYNYNYEGGSIKTETKNHDEVYTISNVIIPTCPPTETNTTITSYSFEGWATSEYGDVIYQPGDTYTQNSNLTLYAQWTASISNKPQADVTVYGIFYDANGGSNAPEASSGVKAGTTIILSTARPTRSGYTFIGWSLDKNDDTADYQPGDSYTVTGATTLYAVWKAGVLDINTDGEIDKTDVTDILKHIVNGNVAVNEKAADVNGDGKVTVVDAIELMLTLAAKPTP